MKRNRRLLLKAAKRIEEVPQSYDQGTFYCKDSRSPCGAASCLAGEIVIASERTVIKGVFKLQGWVNEHKGWFSRPGWVGYKVAELVGLTSDEAEALFGGDADRWPNPFRKQWAAAKTNRGQANAAVRLLRYLADGGAV